MYFDTLKNDSGMKKHMQAMRTNGAVRILDLAVGSGLQAISGCASGGRELFTHDCVNFQNAGFSFSFEILDLLSTRSYFDKTSIVPNTRYTICLKKCTGIQV
jgi:hypothetical protein